MKVNPKHLFVIVLAIILFIIGLSLVLNSTDFGNEAASKVLKNNGGGMDTVQYNIYLVNGIVAYRVAGMILLCLGGIFAFITLLHIDFLQKKSQSKTETIPEA